MIAATPAQQPETRARLGCTQLLKLPNRQQQ